MASHKVDAYTVFNRNPATGNLMDTVSEAYRTYQDNARQRGDAAVTFDVWHDSTDCPPHPTCNFCYTERKRKHTPKFAG